MYINENNEEVLDYLVKLYKKYNIKYRYTTSTADSDRLGYILPELEKILKHFKVKV